MTFSIVVLVFIFVIGLVFGSFLNVVILRTVSGESIVFPSSKCPKCQTPLKWYHNIPLFSYIFLRGRCAFCKEHISFQYPIVELLTGLIFVGLFIKCCTPFDELFGLSMMNSISLYQAITYLVCIIASCFFISIAGTDIIEQKVSDAHTYGLIGLGVIYSIIYSIAAFVIFYNTNGMPVINSQFILSCPVLFSLGGGLIGFLTLEIFSRIGLILVGTRAFGDGDSYIVGGLGALFGALIGISPIYNGKFLPVIYTLITILILSVTLQIIFTLPIFIKKLIQDKNFETLSALAGFVIYTLVYFFLMNTDLFENRIIYWICTIILLALGLYSCIKLILGLKQNNGAGGLFLPFGPALIVAGLVVLFLLPV